MRNPCCNLRPYLIRLITASSSNSQPESSIVSWQHGFENVAERYPYARWKSRKNDWEKGSNPQYSRGLLFQILSVLPAFLIYSFWVTRESLCDSDNPATSAGVSTNYIHHSKSKKMAIESLNRTKVETYVTNESQTKRKETLPALPNGPPKSEKREAEKDTPNTPISVKSLDQDPVTLKTAINLSRSYLNRKMMECGAPGIAISVSIDGENVWSEGLGYSDAENGARMSPHTVLRVASISKCLTMVAVCQLIEEGKLDLDAPVQTYVPSFPQKTVDGKQVVITTRHLLNHTSGIRHYKLKDEIKSKNGKTNSKNDAKSEPNATSTLTQNNNSSPSLSVEEKREQTRKLLAAKCLHNKKPKAKENEFDLAEYFIKEEFATVGEALQLFQDDDLLFKPGEEYYYTTHGWTLVSAVVEAAAGKPFPKLMTELFQDMAMHNTTLDQNEPIIYRRSRYYYRDSSGNLKNSPYVDNSYKWAGGGFLSNVLDLLNFGNLMLYSCQNTDDAEPKGFLKSSTVRSIWTPSPPKSSNPDAENSSNGELSSSYALGWVVKEGERSHRAFAQPRRFFASHTGGAVGASSVLVVVPFEEKNKDNEEGSGLPSGIVVAIVTNLQGVGLQKLALKIANVFANVGEEPKVVGVIGGNSKAKVYTVRKS